jgi:hypothetical protein
LGGDIKMDIINYAKIKKVETDLAQHKLEYVEQVNDLINLNHREYINPLSIIPNDGNPNVCHPSVVKINGGWNGYVYWMAYTPFPPATRENPHIIASHNGIDWVEPNGIVNPVATLAETIANGHGYNSDVDLVYINNQLEMYYRTVGANEESVYKKTSTNGINWSEPVHLLTQERSMLLSPTVVYTEGVWKLWVVDRSSENNYKLVCYSSSNGIDFSVSHICTIQGLRKLSPFLWHMQIRKVGNMYYILASEYTTWDLMFGTSADGINWEIIDNDCIKRSGYEYDETGFYRASFIPTYGSGGLEFDIWANTVKAGESANSDDSSHRIVYYKGVDLIRGNIKLTKSDISRIWLDPSRFSVGYGTPILKVQNQTVPYWELKAGEYARLRTSIILPKHFDKLFFRIYWANLSDLEGNVRLAYTSQYRKVGDLVTDANEIYATEITLPAETQYKIVATDFTLVKRPVEIRDKEFLTFGFDRRGNHEEDDLNGNIAIYGIELLNDVPSI